ncbi:hypothetical protein QQP08_026262 [Theobroma cacao]|uniref:Uncharacterized protein n=1 Tax=Theobroma cacao TaxID=3641 RepID=A0A061GJ26_THECC|nr:Uncharacterized protein TCM_037048 [Theobroma cacao]WRX33775.1 hypothetical protein QQP08_026262 [Theobroma cacao]
MDSGYLGNVDDGAQKKEDDGQDWILASRNVTINEREAVDCMELMEHSAWLKVDDDERCLGKGIGQGSGSTKAGSDDVGAPIGLGR